MSRSTSSARYVSALRLSDTAVTPSDWSIEKATVSEYDGIAADERDVGAVQRRHDARHRAARCGDDVPRQVGGGGVRDRVMRVDDVERLLARDLHDLVRRARARTAARGTAGRPASRTRWKRRPRLIVAEAERRLAAQEVHAVTARGERLGELGRDDAAAADRRVADDADVHGRAPRRAVASAAAANRSVGAADPVRRNPRAKRDAGERPELRVAALDQLHEQRRGQARGRRIVAGRRELRDVARERVAASSRRRPVTSTTKDGAVLSLMK